MDNEIALENKKSVIIVAMTGNILLDFAGPADVFTNADKVLSNFGFDSGYDVKIVSPRADKKIRTSTGITVSCEESVFDFKGWIDTLIIAGNDFSEAGQPSLKQFYRWLEQRTEINTRRIASVCGGAFALAQAGILEGKKVTTHWELSDKLSKSYPNVDVNANLFFSCDGHVFTSAGISSGIDLALGLVEQDYDRDVAIKVARKLVFYLNRPGFQAQFGNLLPTYESEHIATKVQNWLIQHLDKKLDVVKIADYMNMSTRNFTRVFHRETGISPAKFLEKLRIEAARKYLEDTDTSLEIISEKCGLGGLVSMRRIFLRHLNTTPSDYRRAFKTSLKELGISELLESKTNNIV